MSRHIFMSKDHREVSVDRDDESLTDWWRKSLIHLDEFLCVLLHVVYVEKVIETVIFICDQVKHYMAILLVSIDVMENYQSIPIEPSVHYHPCLPVDYVEESL